MAVCVVCGKSTELYDCGVPLCLDCEQENNPLRKTVSVSKICDHDQTAEDKSPAKALVQYQADFGRYHAIKR